MNFKNIKRILVLLTLVLAFAIPANAKTNFSVFPDLKIEDKSPFVVQIQQFLNTNGYTVNPVSGQPGSLGYETDKFGALTKLALSAFQSKFNIPSTGYFGPLTKAKMDNMSGVASAKAPGKVLGVTSCTSVTNYTITWFFDKSYTCGQFANGDWWVVGPVTITDITPRSTVHSDGWIDNGTVINPPPTSLNLGQGFDSSITFGTWYNSSLNVAPSIIRRDLVVPNNSSVVSADSKSTKSTVTADTQFDYQAILTVLPSEAPAGSFRPAPTGTDKTIRWNKSDLNYNILKSLDDRPASTPLLSNVESEFSGSWFAIAEGDAVQAMTPPQMKNYGRDASKRVEMGLLSLNLDYTNAQKENLYIKMVQYGIDVYGSVKAGMNFRGAGGLNNGRKAPMVLAGLALNDSDIKEWSNRNLHNVFGEDKQTFFVTQSDVGRPVTNDIEGGFPRQTYLDEHVGLAEWGEQHEAYPDRDASNWGDASYRWIGGSQLGIALGIKLIGGESTWNWPAFFAYEDRYWSKEGINPTLGWEIDKTNGISKFTSDMWKAHRGSTTMPPPPPSETTCNSATQFGITWTFDRAYPCGRYANGDWWVVGPVTITNITPKDDNPNDTFLFSDNPVTYRPLEMHGTMINPDYAAFHYNTSNGWDSRIHYGLYDASKNIAKTLPKLVQNNSSVMSAISFVTTIPLGNNDPQLETIAILTIVPNAPADGSFRPPYINGANKAITWNKSQLDYTKLKSLAPVEHTPTLSFMEPKFERPFISLTGEWTGDYVIPKLNSALYGREISQEVGEAGLLLNLNYSNAQKEKLLIGLVQRGIDIYGISTVGGGWRGDGGHMAGRKFPMMFAGAVLNDNAILARANNYFAEDRQHFYVTQADVNMARVTYDCNATTGTCLSQTEDFITPYTASMIGTAEWGTEHVESPSHSGSDWRRSYRNVVGPGTVSGALAARLMNLQTAWNWPAYFDYADRYYVIESAAGHVSYSSNHIQPFTDAMWRAYRNGGTDLPPLPPPTLPFEIGARIKTNVTVNVRASASLTGTLLGTQAANNQGVIIGGGTVASGYTWWNINYDNGVDGWTADNNLTVISSPPTVTDSVKSVSGPSAVQIGNTYNVSTTYDASGSKDMSVYLFANPSGNYTLLSQSTIPAPAGTNRTVTNSVNIPASTPANTELGYFSFITPTGQPWNSSSPSMWQKGVTTGVTNTYTLTTTPGTGGTITGNTSPYVSGATATLTAVPNTGYAFLNWTGCTGTNGTTCTVTMNANKTVTANFVVTQIPTYTLTANKIGTGSGTITGNTSPYTNGATATLTAVPATGSVFSSWTGCTTTSGAVCTVTMDGNKTVTAIFTVHYPGIYTITATKTGAGLGVINGNASPYVNGGTATLTVVTSANSIFTGWGGACTGTNTTCTILMNGNKTVTANFNLITYTLTANKAGTGSGTITGNTSPYAPATTATLTAVPAQGSTFTSWSGCTTTNGAVCTVGMSSDKTVTATFTLTPTTLTPPVITSPSNGVVLPSNTTSVTAVWTGNASNYLVRATSSNTSRNTNLYKTYRVEDTYASTTYPFLVYKGENYHFWVHSGTMNKYSTPSAEIWFSVANDVTYTLTTTKVGQGTISGANPTYVSGTTATLTATPATGYTFSNWSGACQGTGTCTILMNGNKTVTANFTQIPVSNSPLYQQTSPLTFTGTTGGTNISVDNSKISSKLTVSAKIKRGSDVTDYAPVVHDENYGSSKGYYLGDLLAGKDSPICFRVNGITGNTYVACEPNAILNSNSFTHYVGVFDGTAKTISLYRDGTLVKRVSHPSSTVSTNTTNGAIIGGSIKGGISEVKIYNTILDGNLNTVAVNIPSQSSTSTNTAGLLPYLLSELSRLKAQLEALLR